MKDVLSFLNKYKYIIIPGLLGAIFFILIYGIKVLNPTNIDWILIYGGDITQHYLGWEFYRYSPWDFPIGLNTLAVYPDSISVIFTDSIPLFAVIFKLFSNVLPEQFQYLGIYGLICFILQGIFSGIVLKKFIKQDFIIIILSLFLIVSPIMIYRMYYHTALASHFLILMAFALVLYRDKFNLKQTILLWGLLGFLCASIHIYFLLFTGIIWIGYLVYEILTNKLEGVKKIVSSLSFLLVAALTIFILGGFSSPTSPFGKNNIGIFNFNLNGFINSMGYSTLFKEMPLANSFAQREGFSYLGVGLIVVVILAILSSLILLISRLIKRKKININWKFVISIILVSIISFLFASAYKIYFNDTLLFEYRIPEFINNIIGVFRANARAIWIVYYILIFLSFYILYKIYNKYIFSILIIILFGIQMCDFKNWLTGKNVEFTDNIKYVSELKDERWDRLFQEDFKNVILTSEFINKMGKMYSIDLYVLKYKKDINRFNITQNFIYDVTNKRLEYFKNNISDNELYLIDGSIIFENNNLGLNYYHMDDIFIATSLELDYLDKANINKVKYETASFLIELKFDINKKYKFTITGIDEINDSDFEYNGDKLDVINNEINVNVFKKSEILIKNENYKKVIVEAEEII